MLVISSKQPQPVLAVPRGGDEVLALRHSHDIRHVIGDRSELGGALNWDDEAGIMTQLSLKRRKDTGFIGLDEKFGVRVLLFKLR